MTTLCRLDDIAFAYLPVKRKTRTLLVTRGNQYLETLLKLDPLRGTLRRDPASYQESSNIDAYIFDRFAPPTAPARPALIIGTPSAPWLKPSTGEVQKPEITTWSERSSGDAVRFRSRCDHRARVADRRGSLTVIAASKQTPLIVASEKPKWVMLTFDLQSSDFPFHVGFPVFIENVLAWFSREQLALKRGPGIVDVPWPPPRYAPSTAKSSHPINNSDKTVFRNSEPGLYIRDSGR